MRVGFNYPVGYNRYGNQIGPDINVDPPVWNNNNALEASGKLSDIRLPPIFEHVDRNLANLKKMGFSVIRWFLLGNGTNYGPAPTKVTMTIGSPGFPAPPGYSASSVYYTFNPPPILDKRFRRDFEELLKRFKVAQLQLIPSLIDFYFGSETKQTGPGPNGTGSAGRADVIRDPVKRKIFLDTVLAELLAASAPFKEQIYAWEVINEPIWLCQEFGVLSNPDWAIRLPEVSFSQMSDFLTDAIGRIKAAGFKATVGHRFFDDLQRFPTKETEYLPQFHYYAKSPWYAVGPYKADPPSMKGAKLFGGKSKPMLGEFDSSENRYGEPWKKDLGGANQPPDSTLERLRLLDSQGCDLALIWANLGYDPTGPGRPDDATLKAEQALVDKNDVIKLLYTTRSAIVAYTAGTLPPAGE